MELQRLVSLNQLLHESKVRVDDVQNVCFKPEDMLPSMVLLRLIRAVHCFLRLHPTVR